MKSIFLAFLLVCFNLHASSIIRSRVSTVDFGIDGEHNLLLLENGAVLKFQNTQIQKSETFLENQYYEFEIDKDRFVLTYKIIKARPYELSSPVVQETYIPTTVKDLGTLKSYFRESPYNPKDSQCFNRAMVWSYGWWKDHSLKSMKLFIFFTRNYIRKYNFEWWFHVAPYAHVLVDEQVVERVLDVKYTNGPLAFKQWTDVFMKNDAVCPVITKYSEYADNPYTGDCFIYRANMYFYQPADLQMNEAWGYDKSAFNMNEVRGAYKEAFDIEL